MTSPAMLAIADVIRQAVDTLVGIPGFAIYGKQDAPRPDGAYADINFLSDVAVGWEQSTWADSGDLDVTQTIEGLREIGFSIGFYRTGSYDYCRRVRVGMIRERINSTFNRAGLGLIRRSEVREISTALEPGWEQRANFDLYLSAVGHDQDIIEAILTAGLTGNYVRSLGGGGFSNDYSIQFDTDTQ